MYGDVKLAPVDNADPPVWFAYHLTVSPTLAAAVIVTTPAPQRENSVIAVVKAGFEYLSWNASVVKQVDPARFLTIAL